MVMLLVGRSKVANYQYYVTYKIKDWSPLENNCIHLIKNNWSKNPGGWECIQYVFINKVARCDKDMFFFPILSTFLETIPLFSEYLSKAWEHIENIYRKQNTASICA